MFFLGGFNTILPHLLYLSIIWACLIIGFSGRIDFLQIENSVQYDNHSTYVSSGINPVEFDLPALQLQEGELCTTNRILKIQITSTCLLPDKVPILFRTVGRIDYRGPPTI